MATTLGAGEVATEVASDEGAEVASDEGAEVASLAVELVEGTAGGVNGTEVASLTVELVEGTAGGVNGAEVAALERVLTGWVEFGVLLSGTGTYEVVTGLVTVQEHSEMVRVVASLTV